MFSHLQISIPVMSVTFIKKTKTALLVPNALVIETKSYQVRSCSNSQFFTFEHERKSDSKLNVFQHVFVSFLSRNTTYKLLKSICIHLEVNNILFILTELSTLVI